MAARVSINYKETALDVITYAGRTRLGRVQRADIGANLPNTPVSELGSNQLVGRIFDLPEITVTVSSMDVGARSVFTMAAQDWASIPSGTRMEAQDIRYVCLAQPFKGAASDDIAQTLYVPGAKLDRISLNYSATGDATEEFSFMATNRLWLKYDVATSAGTLSASGTMTTPSGARELKSGRFYLSAFASGIGYVPHDSILSSDASTIVFDTTAVPGGTPVLITYHADLTNQWDYTYEYPHIPYRYEPAPDQPVGMRGWGIEVYLMKSGVSNERVYRAQTCTIQSQLPNTKIQELGTEEVVGYSEGIPDVTGTLDILVHDFKLTQQLSGDTTGDNWDPNELGNGDWGLLIKMFRRGVDRTTVGPEKTIWIPALDVTQEQNSANVGQDSKITFNFSSRMGNIYFYKGDKLD